MRYHTIDIFIPAGGTNDSIRVKFPVDGKVERAALFEDAPTKETVSILLERADGNTLIESSDAQDWVQSTGADYMSRKKPMGFFTQDITIKANSTKPQAADYFARLMFVIDDTQENI